MRDSQRQCDTCAKFTAIGDFAGAYSDTCKKCVSAARAQGRRRASLREELGVTIGYKSPKVCPKCGGFVAAEGDEYPHCAMCGWEDYRAPDPKIAATGSSSLSSFNDAPMTGLSSKAFRA